MLTGDAKDLEAARKGEVLFYRESLLSAGAYQVETMVYDAIAEKGSARVSTVIVPGPDSPRLKMDGLRPRLPYGEDDSTRGAKRRPDSPLLLRRHLAVPECW